MKKFIAGLTTLSLVAGILGVATVVNDNFNNEIKVSAEEELANGVIGEGYYNDIWGYKAQKVAITSYWGEISEDGVVNVPSQIPEDGPGVLVNEIGAGAFNGNDFITEVNMPETLEYIGDSAFMNMSNLKGIIIPTNIISIGDKAFKGDRALTGVSYHGEPEIIGDEAFDGCVQIKSASGPSSTELKEIGVRAYHNCVMLESVTLGSAIETIGDGAFLNTGLTEVTIPESVERIGNNAFGYVYTSGESGTVKKVENFKIYCYAGTEGERYAEANGFDYTLLNAPEVGELTVTNPTYTKGGKNGWKVRATWEDTESEIFSLEVYDYETKTWETYPTSEKYLDIDKLKTGGRYKFRVRGAVSNGKGDYIYGKYSNEVLVVVPSEVEASDNGENVFWIGGKLFRAVNTDDKINIVNDTEYSSTGIKTVTEVEEVVELPQDWVTAIMGENPNLIVRCKEGSLLEKLARACGFKTEIESNSIKYQLGESTDETVAIRFIGEIDVEDINKADSAIVTVSTGNAGELGTVKISKAYRAIMAGGKTVKAADGKLFVLITVNNIPKSCCNSVNVKYTFDNVTYVRDIEFNM